MSLVHVAAVCVGIAVGLIFYYISNNEQHGLTQQHQESSFRSDKRKDSYAEYRNYRDGLGEDGCSICPNTLKDQPTIYLTCQHRPHRSCFELCLKNDIRQCPKCRKYMY